MPSGRTHDSITLWSLPLVVGLTFERTQSSSLTLMVSGGFLFSGLMFGPDLDIYSRQYRRWGWLRWIWLPYRRGMRHRSLLSHGPLVGTVVRVLYLLFWLTLLALGIILVSAIASQLLGVIEQWQLYAQHLINLSTQFIGQSLQKYPAEGIALMIGLELGALSHSLSDWMTSTYKRNFASRKSSATRDRSAEPMQASFNVKPPKPEPSAPKTILDNIPSTVQSYFQPKQDRSSGSQPSTSTQPSTPPHLKRVPDLPPFLRQRKQ